jgi:hypothetical protein
MEGLAGLDIADGSGHQIALLISTFNYYFGKYEAAPNGGELLHGRLPGDCFVQTV